MKSKKRPGSFGTLKNTSHRNWKSRRRNEGETGYASWQQRVGLDTGILSAHSFPLSRKTFFCSGRQDKNRLNIILSPEMISSCQHAAQLLSSHKAQSLIPCQVPLLNSWTDQDTGATRIFLAQTAPFSANTRSLDRAVWPSTWYHNDLEPTLMLLGIDASIGIANFGLWHGGRNF